MYATIAFWLLLTKPTKDDEGEKEIEGKRREKEKGKRSERKQRRLKIGIVHR
jgi:hypothetical protein